MARRSGGFLIVVLLLAMVAVGIDVARGGPLSPEERYAKAPVEKPKSPSPSPSHSESPSPSPSPTPVAPRSGAGTFVTASGKSDVFGTGGQLLRYRVRVEKGSHQDVAEFAQQVDATLGDKRSWIGSGDLRLQRTDSNSYQFTVFLATPRTTDRLCAPLPTSSYTSCRQGDRVVVNLERWVFAVKHWNVDLHTYRQYVINHEVGHRLGHGHEVCPGAGKPAPVMQQQTLKLDGCTANAWPYLNGKAYHGPVGSYATA